MGKNTKTLFSVFIFLSILFNAMAYTPQEELNEVLKKCNQAVVSIIVYDSNKKEITQGKGVILSSDGFVLTNYHIICQAHSAKVRLAETKKIRKKVEWENVFYPGYQRESLQKKKAKGKWIDVEGVVSFEKILDFALIKIAKKGYPYTQLAKSDELEIGDKAIIVVDDDTISEGTITGLNDLIETKKVFQINLPFSPGMSGSPLFNTKGEVIGIASYITENSNLIFPGFYAFPLIKEEKATPLSKFAHEDYFTTSEGLYLKGMACSIMKDYNKSLSLLEESIRINPKNSYAHSHMGFLLSKLNRYERAVDAYNEAVKLNPNDYKAFFGLGIAHIRLNDYQRAIDPLTQCTALNPNFPDAFYNLGLTYESLGELEKAVNAYQEYIKINHGPAWIGLNQLGSVYVKLAQYDKAVTVFQEVLKSNPSDLKATYNLAFAYDMSGQYDLAVPLYRKLINLNPKEAKAYYSLLFRLHDKAGQYEKAVEVGQEIILQSPDNPNDHYNLGIIYYKMKDYEKALETYRHALSLNQNFEPAYYNIGLVHFKQEKYAEAIEAFTKFVQLKPNQPDAYYNIGAGYLQIKKYEEAIEPLQRAIELKPDYALAHYNLGIAYYVVGDRFSANEEYKTLRSLDPNLAEKLQKIIKK